MGGCVTTGDDVGTMADDAGVGASDDARVTKDKGLT